MGIIIQLWKLQSIWMFKRAVGSGHVCLWWTRQAEAGGERIWVFVGFGKQEIQHCGALAPELKPTCLWQWHTYSSPLTKLCCAQCPPPKFCNRKKSFHFCFHCTTLVLDFVISNIKLSLLASEVLLLQICVFPRTPHQEQHQSALWQLCRARQWGVSSQRHLQLGTVELSHGWCGMELSWEQEPTPGCHCQPQASCACARSGMWDGLQLHLLLDTGSDGPLATACQWHYSLAYACA